MDAGTDTMAFTASALSLMLLGFRKPIVITGVFEALHLPVRIICVLLIPPPAALPVLIANNKTYELVN